MRNTMRYAVVVAALCAIAAPAFADILPQVGDKMYFTGYMNGQQGGSLLANPTAGSNFTPFRSFCVEIEEVVWVGGGSNFQYEISSIGMQTVNGGKTLTSQAAWLYSQYRTNSLNAYNDGQLADRNALQYGIWNAMGYTDTELLAHFGSGFQSAIDSYGTRSWAGDFAASDWDGVGNVRIANMVWGNTHQGQDPGCNAQDQLILVPVPGAALLGVVGLGIVAHLKRRFS